ncbi:hypothetical protein CLUG_03915 [Clavispora lusitaniae ATCC 42720]|uniref:Uncharacterized protein n=1 Tax=Clavispora lusitaniae (strain ATCC 42720) TaxID=306902 RepID=C4Y6Y1_CLAL4|nr:uncharacterized protein CLUG_03915 [Clavispora lusitaniae ATCC 42720]EEQ39787.1 hypothetical protein CLUG_03915 [Clavispora lusitaniae ATCC 42720]
MWVTETTWFLQVAKRRRKSFKRKRISESSRYSIPKMFLVPFAMSACSPIFSKENIWMSAFVVQRDLNGVGSRFCCFFNLGRNVKSTMSIFTSAKPISTTTRHGVCQKWITLLFRPQSSRKSWHSFISLFWVHAVSLKCDTIIIICYTTRILTRAAQYWTWSFVKSSSNGKDRTQHFSQSQVQISCLGI